MKVSQLSIWRHNGENSSPIIVYHQYFGYFVTDDAYVVLCEDSKDLFIWIGAECTKDAKASAARHAGDLIKNLDADTKFSRVMQGNEGPEFTSLFPGEKLTFLNDEADLPPPPPPPSAAPSVVAPEQQAHSIVNDSVIITNLEEEVEVAVVVEEGTTTTEHNILDTVPPSTPTGILLSDAILKGTPGMSQQTEQEGTEENNEQPQEEEVQSSKVPATGNREVTSPAITTTALNAPTPPPDDDGDDEAMSPAKKVSVPPTPPPDDDGDVGDTVEKKVEQLAIGSSDVEKKKKKKKKKKNNNSQNVEEKKEAVVVVAPKETEQQQQQEEQESLQIKTTPPPLAAATVETTNDKVDIPSPSIITTTTVSDTTTKPISPKVSQIESEAMAQKKAAFMSRLSQDSGNNNNYYYASSPSPTPATKAWTPSPVATTDIITNATVPVVAVSQLMKVTIPGGSKIITYEELKNMKLESGIDMTQKESYLSDEEFEKVFGKSKGIFTGQPRWRQQIDKKSVGLF